MAALPQADRPADAARPRPASHRRQLRHPQAPEGAGVAGEASPLQDAFHADLLVLAQSRRALLRRPDRRRDPRRQFHLGQRTGPRHQGLSGAAQQGPQALHLAGRGCRDSRQNQTGPRRTRQSRRSMSSCTAIESRDTRIAPVNTFESPLLGLSQRLPPANIQAEQALLGALLANNRAFERVADFLQPEHFADPVHGRIYQAIARRVDAGNLADAITLKAEFEHAGVLDEVGGVAYLGQLLSAMVGIINAGEYGRAIYDAWMRRQLIDIGETVVNNAFGAEPELDGRKQVEVAEQ